MKSFNLTVFNSSKTMTQSTEIHGTIVLLSYQSWFSSDWAQCVRCHDKSIAEALDMFPEYRPNIMNPRTWFCRVSIMCFDF